ncbi:hypothetical protein CGLO_13110 [Colletotrichum gloeosporioides Cg-14]|uniref:Uncharacterized protein n=1 Tax=Colletotrichum gloeosporioides (strain Cg-14) TaxID=1237896 RepID=T0K4D5_COLGC|nr:hypothetical protein CGLO_13110 [Colletotrichum gloeosporioides Cg-14]
MSNLAITLIDRFDKLLWSTEHSQHPLQKTMKLSLLVAVVGLVSQICAGSDYTLNDAADLLYFYTVYQLDVEVCGVGKSYIALNCRGTGTGNRCTYNAFVSYIETGSVTSAPTIYNITSKWEFALNSVMDSSHVE